MDVFRAFQSHILPQLAATGVFLASDLYINTLILQLVHRLLRSYSKTKMSTSWLEICKPEMQYICPFETTAKICIGFLEK